MRVVSLDSTVIFKSVPSISEIFNSYEVVPLFSCISILLNIVLIVGESFKGLIVIAKL